MMKQAPFFSICIPNYNYAHYLGETIESVLAQTCPDFEIVVVDNASSDDSLDVVRSYEDPRIRLFCNRYNVGFAPNLQRVTEKAKGRFFILLSSDDLMYPGALARYRQVLEEQGEMADQTVLAAATEMVDSSGRPMKVLHKPAGRLTPRWIDVGRAQGIVSDGQDRMRGREVLRYALTRSLSIAAFCATCYPRAMWEEVEGYDTAYQIFPDAAFLHKLLALDPNYIWINDRLFAYRVHDTNQTARASRQAALKEQVDGYIRTVNYPQGTLDSLGVERRELVRSYVRVLCVGKSLAFLSRGSWLQGLKSLAFAFATYPIQALREPRTYAACFLTALGPVGVLLARLARKVVHEHEPTSVDG